MKQLWKKVGYRTPEMNRRQFMMLASQMGALVALNACSSGSSTAPAVDAPAEAAATATSAPVAAEEPALGRSLIGELEGPEVVIDENLWPTAFNEAPELADRVAAGELPPVQERIGSHPLVIKPVHEIGQYGGTWRRGFTGPGDAFNGWRAATGPDSLLFWDYTGQVVVPNIARDWEVTEEGRVITLYLREGMKWSDGEPFTADDFVFWFEDIYSNEELIPRPSIYMTINGKPGTLEKVDDYTVRLVFPDPYYLIETVLAGSTSLDGHARQGRSGMGLYAPAHYLKQFHPKYVSEEELNAKVEEAGFDNWRSLFLARNDWALNPDLPVVTPWKVVSPINTPTWELERNPYSIWVDTEGNQLPYIDRIVMSLAENLEVLNLRAIAGDYDFQARHIDIGKLPVFLENRDSGNYDVYLDTGTYGSDMFIAINKTYAGDEELRALYNNVDFRRALSLGINREELNEIFWLGLGVPSTVVPEDSNIYNPGPEYRTLWATYDPEQANALLDGIGLTERDSEGYRMRSDGTDRIRLELMTYGGQFLQYTQISEVIRTQWQQIGIDVQINEVERSLGESMHAANETQMYAWTSDGTDHFHNYAGNAIPIGSGSFHGALWGLWFQSNGEEGEEPPESMKKILDNFRRSFGVPEEERIALTKEIWAILTDEVYLIGVVGLSPAAQGIRIVNRDMGNIPARQYNSPDVKNPAISRPVTFFYKTQA
jgi:peptide/nickel transport system substrate-binding protein